MKYRNQYFSLLAIISIMFLCCHQSNENVENTNPPNSTTAPVNIVQVKPSDKNSLLGNWIRTDADYQLKVSAVEDNGNVKAGYFNPKSINVSKSLWDNKDGVLKIYIELRDENYPGSYYKLNYRIEQDALTGEYFQAVEGTTYQVAFTRVK